MSDITVNFAWSAISPISAALVAFCTTSQPSYDDEDLILVANAAQVLLDPLPDDRR